MTKIISEIVGSILNFIPQTNIKSVLVSSEKFITPYLQFGDLTDKILCSLNKQELKEAIKNCMWNKQKTFLYACKKGHYKIIKFLLSDSRINPAASNNEAIILASWFGPKSVVELLLSDSRVDPTANNNLAIEVASEHGNISVVELLLNWRGPSDSQGKTKRVDPIDNNNLAIHLASIHGHHEVIKLLLNWSKQPDSIVEKTLLTDKKS